MMARTCQSAVVLGQPKTTEVVSPTRVTGERKLPKSMQPPSRRNHSWCRRCVTPPHFGNLQFRSEVDLTAARKGSSNSEMLCPANRGYGSRPSVSYSLTAFRDCRFSEWMKSLLSQSRHRVKGTIYGTAGLSECSLDPVGRAAVGIDAASAVSWSS